MANVYQRGTEYIYQQPEVYYQAIEYFYWPVITGSVGIIYNSIPEPPGVGATLDYENMEYLWQDGYNKVFGLNIEYVYSPGDNAASIGCVYNAVYPNQTGSVNIIYNSIPGNVTGALNVIYNATPQLIPASSYINIVYNAEIPTQNNSLNIIYNGVMPDVSGSLGIIYDSIPRPPSTGGFIMRTYVPFAFGRRRLPVVYRNCENLDYPYPTGTVEC